MELWTTIPSDHHREECSFVDLFSSLLSSPIQCALPHWRDSSRSWTFAYDRRQVVGFEFLRFTPRITTVHNWNAFGEVKTGWRMLLHWTQSYMTIRDILRFPIGSAIIQVVAFTLRSSPKQVNSAVALPPQCSSLGLSHGWRTRTFQASERMSEPFFFDSSGSFYAQTSPPLLIIQATEQSLVPTSQVHRPSVIFLSSSPISMGSPI